MSRDQGAIGRRTFFKVLGVGAAAATGVVPLSARAAPGKEKETPGKAPAVLVDTTRCMGCRTCEVSCAEANDLPKPNLDEDVFGKGVRETTDTQRTVVNLFKTDKGEVYVKKQCMHCQQPACASACLTKAMYKTDDGPVIWRGNKCMGCRFCMVSCPFDVPKFEYNSWNPKINKCTMCYERVEQGRKPACVQNCPFDALTFGTRDQLLQEAHARIAANPGQYHPAIYGEREVGGTNWLYLASVPFEQIGLNTRVGETPYPEFAKPFLYTVPLVLTLGPAFMLGLNAATKPEPEKQEEEASDGKHHLPGRDVA